jgi:hypothetical protein
MAVALVAAFIGIVRIAPLVYPYNHSDVDARNAVFNAIKKQELHHAVVFINRGTSIANPLDQTQNLPMDFYDDDVLIAIDLNNDVEQCVKNRFSNRKIYRATGWRDLSFIPMP